MTDLADVPAARPSRPSRTNAGSRMTKLLCAETKSLKTFTKEAADELKASGIRVDRKRERERERAPHHREEAVSSDGDAENAMHEGEENSPEVAEPAAEAGGAEAGLAAAKPSRGAAAAGGAQLSKTALDQIPRRGIDRMPGCPKCRFSKGGCNGCLRTPMVTRPAVRWNPEKAHPQKDIPSADTVYPTAEEFADPLAYIESIRHLGEKCGVVCIVPPPGWDPPFALHPTAAASAATAAGAAAAAAAATTAAVPGGKDTSKEDSTALRFQVRKQFTSHLCMRAPSSSFQTESRAKGLGSPEAEPCRMMGGGGRMGGGGSGRMGGGGGSAGRMGGGMGRNNACAVGMAAKATESPLAAWQRPGAPEGAGSAAQPSSAIVCVPAEVPAVKLPVCVVAPAAALRGGGRARAAPRRSARAYEDDSECSDPTVEERAGRGGSGRSLAASAAPQLLPSSPIAATARVAIPAVSPCAPAARIPAAVLDPALGAAGRGRRAAQPRRRRGGRAGKDTDEEEEEGEFVSDDGVSQETQSEDEPQLGRGRRGLQRRAAAAAAAARRQMQGDGSDDDENTSTDDELGGEFGHGLLDRSHTLKSFMAYAEWAKAKHFGLAAGGGGGGSGMTDAARRAAQRGSWVPNNWQPGRRAAAAQPRPPPPPPLAPTPPPPGAEPGSEPAAAEPCMRGTRGGGRTAAHDGDVAAGPGRGAAAGPSGRNELTMEELEAEFWRIVESPSQVVETLYGSDLDSGRHGSGFPLPHWRAAPTDASAVRPPKEDARCAEYSAHPWNINCLTRSKGSVLRYVRCKELVTGVMVPWLYVGSCMSAFCWHVEDHALYSINYLHLGAPKVWYGIPAYAAEAFEAAMHDALPHLFVEDPLLLHRLVTMLSPNQLKARGVPVYRLVHQPGSFVITFPNAYHAGFNTGFNCAEAVNFAPADWLPYGTDVLRKYRTQGKPLTISHDQLLVTLVQAAPLVAKAQARKQQQQQQQQQEQEGGTSDAMDTSHAGPSSGGGTAEGCEGLDLYGEGGWMQRWQDGASMSDVPVQAVLIATGELAVRVDEEEARRAAAAAAGVSKEEVMSGNCEAEQDSRGLHVDTGDCDCEVCKCDLYMSAVVSELVPGRCVCPNHVAALGVDPASCKLLYRFSMPQLHSMLQTATKLFPASEQHMQQARARQEAKPVVTAKPLGPVVRFGPDGERLGEGVKAEGEKEGEEGRQGGKAKVKVEAKEEGDGMDDDPEEEEEQEQEEEEEEEEERHGRRGRGSRRQPAHGRAGRAAPQPKRLMHAKVEPTVMQLQQQPFPPPPPPLSPPTSPSGRRAARGAAAAAASGDGVPAHSGRSAAAVVSPRAQQGASASNAAAAGGVAGVAVVGPAVSCVPRVAARRSKQGLVGDAKLAAAAAIGGYRTPGAQQGHAVVDGAAAADTASASPVRGIGGRGGDDRAAAAQARAPVTTGLAGNVMPPPPPPLFAAKLTASVASEAAAGAAAAAEAAAAAAAAAEAIAAAAAAKAVQGASVTAGGTKRRRTPAVEVEAEVGRDDTDGSDEAREECFAFGAKRRRTTRRAGGAPAARWKAAAASLPAWPLPQSPDATPKAPAAAPVRRGPGAAAPAAAAGGGSFAIPEDLMAWARASGAPAAPAAAAALLPAQPQQPQPQQAPPAAHQVSSSLAHLQALLASPSAGGGAAAVNPFLRPPATVAPQQLQQPQQPLAAFGALLSNPTATMAMAAALLAMTSRQAQQGQQGHQPAAGGMPVQPSAPAVHVVAPSGAPAAHQQQ